MRKIVNARTGKICMGDLRNSASASLDGTNLYAYAYDAIGNRVSATETTNSYSYTANALNQYTSIVGNNDGTFVPEYDDDGHQKSAKPEDRSTGDRDFIAVPQGRSEERHPATQRQLHQTKVKTETGVWRVAYNGENRPVAWSNGTTNIVMSFDRRGRRVQYLEVCGGSTNVNNTFTYDNYLLIDRKRHSPGGVPTTDRFVWDVTEPVETRPLVFCAANAPPQYYSHDGNKNVSELSPSGGVAVAHCEYSPFGGITYCSERFPRCSPYRFSSEYSDDRLGVLYYNYRHYNPGDGRWLCRDIIGVYGGINEFSYCINDPTVHGDILGLGRNDPPDVIDTGIVAPPIVDKCSILEAKPTIKPDGNYFEIWEATPIRLDVAVMKGGDASGYGYSNLQKANGVSGIPLSTLSGWNSYEEGRNTGLMDDLSAKKRYTCSIKFLACCKRKVDGSSYVYEGEEKSTGFVEGRTGMAKDTERLAWFSSTPAEVRYKNAYFFADPQQETKFETDCENKARKLRTVERVRAEYTESEIFSLFRKENKTGALP